MESKTPLLEGGAIQRWDWKWWQAGIIVQVSVGLQMLNKNPVQTKSGGRQENVEVGRAISAGHHLQKVAQQVVLGEALQERFQDGIGV